MARKALNIVWYGTLLGVALLIFDKLTHGITGGLKKGLGDQLPSFLR